jgi:hypothetical protein
MKISNHDHCDCVTGTHWVELLLSVFDGQYADFALGFSRIAHLTRVEKVWSYPLTALAILKIKKESGCSTVVRCEPGVEKSGFDCCPLRHSQSRVFFEIHFFAPIMPVLPGR